MAQKCYSYNTKNAFTSGLVYTEKVNVKTLDNNHDTMVSVCSQSTIKMTSIGEFREDCLIKQLCFYF